MGQKVNPISNRLGVIRGWDSNWFGGKKYGDTLLEDSKLRKYLNVRLAKSSVSKIVIERTLKLITITVCTSRPGLIIGKGGSEVDKLKEELKKITDKEGNTREAALSDIDYIFLEVNSSGTVIIDMTSYEEATKDLLSEGEQISEFIFSFAAFNEDSGTYIDHRLTVDIYY